MDIFLSSQLPMRAGHVLKIGDVRFPIAKIGEAGFSLLRNSQNPKGAKGAIYHGEKLEWLCLFSFESFEGELVNFEFKRKFKPCLRAPLDYVDSAA